MKNLDRTMFTLIKRFLMLFTIIAPLVLSTFFSQTLIAASSTPTEKHIFYSEQKDLSSYMLLSELLEKGFSLEEVSEILAISEQYWQEKDVALSSTDTYYPRNCESFKLLTSEKKLTLCVKEHTSSNHEKIILDHKDSSQNFTTPNNENHKISLFGKKRKVIIIVIII